MGELEGLRNPKSIQDYLDKANRTFSMAQMEELYIEALEITTNELLGAYAKLRVLTQITEIPDVNVSKLLRTQKSLNYLQSGIFIDSDNPVMIQTMSDLTKMFIAPTVDIEHSYLSLKLDKFIKTFFETNDRKAAKAYWGESKGRIDHFEFKTGGIVEFKSKYTGIHTGIFYHSFAMWFKEVAMLEMQEEATAAKPKDMTTTKAVISAGIA